MNNSLSKNYYFYPFLILLFLTFIVVGLQGSFVYLFTSFFISYYLFPILKKIENIGIKRPFSIAFIFLIILFLFSLFVLLIFPPIQKDIRDFTRELPQLTQNGVALINSKLSDLGINFIIEYEAINKIITSWTKNLNASTLKPILLALNQGIKGVTKGLIGLINLILIPVFLFYILNKFEEIKISLKQFVPLRYRKFLFNYLHTTNKIFNSYIRGQLTVCLILAVFYSTGLVIAKLPFGIFIGVTTGLLTFLPYIGPLIGIVIAISVSLILASPSTLIGVLIVFFIAQILEGFILTPKITGEKVGLSAFAVFLSLIIGGNYGGFFGMIVAIPISASLKILFSEVKKNYFSAEFYVRS